MRILRIGMSFVLAACLCSVALAASAPSPTIVMPGKEHWAQQTGNFSMSVLYGDPSKAGLYIVRLKIPANWTIPSHHHPENENVTVISGTFYAGMGPKMDKNKVSAFPAGSFISVPANMPHYALTKSSPAVIQLEGQGPLETLMQK